jgi:hypothetical protein
LNVEKIGGLEGYNVTVVDQFTSTSTVLGEEDVYMFSVTSDAKSIAPDRFRVTFSENTPHAVDVSAPIAACENSTASINIENADSHVTYQLTYKGNILKEVSGAEAHTVEVGAASLADSENVFVVNAVGACGTVLPVGQTIIKRGEGISPVVLPVAPVCGSGKAVLTATGNVSGKYNWYETQNATIAVAEGTNSFETPSLNKTRSYYVTALNELGCEGPRVEVPVNVVQTKPISIAIQEDELFTDQTGTVEWYKDGQKIDGAVGNRFTPNASGYYHVSSTSNGCVSIAPKVYFEFLNRGDLPYGIVLFPNPMALTLRLNYPEKAEFKRAALYNNTGIFVREFMLQTTNGNINGELDVRNLPAGIYIVKVFSEREVIAVKVVKE